MTELVTSTTNINSHTHITPTATFGINRTLNVSDDVIIDLGDKVYTVKELKVMLEVLEELAKEKYPEKYI